MSFLLNAEKLETPGKTIRSCQERIGFYLRKLIMERISAMRINDKKRF
jgi:hypothetical protein